VRYLRFVYQNVESMLRKSSLAFSDQAKVAIKEKIDELEALDEEDFEVLIATMRSNHEIKLIKEISKMLSSHKGEIIQEKS
jgi:3-dehydroquinate dehydratase